MTEGVRAVERLVASTLRVRGIVVTPELSATPRGRALLDLIRDRSLPTDELSQDDFADIAHTDAPQGVLAIADIPVCSLESITLAGVARVLVLDAVQDPGNVGTMIRTAAAFRASCTLALPGTVDVWNAKVIRSAMGAHFDSPVVSCTWPELDAFLSAHDTPLWGADAAGDPVAQVAPPGRLALAVGNEGAGLTREALDRAARLVRVPMAPDAESLNVAVAAGILLYELTP